MKAGHGGREAAEDRKVDLEELEQDAGELSVEELDIIIADVVLEQSGVVLPPQQRTDADPLDEFHNNVRAQAERVSSPQSPGNDAWDGDVPVAEKAQYLHLHCNFLVGVVVADVADDGHAEKPGGAIAKVQHLAQIVRAIGKLSSSLHSSFLGCKDDIQSVIRPARRAWSTRSIQSRCWMS